MPHQTVNEQISSYLNKLGGLLLVRDCWLGGLEVHGVTGLTNSLEARRLIGNDRLTDGTMRGKVLEIGSP